MRKEAVAKEKKAQSEKDEDDAKWADNDPKVLKAQEKERERLQKQADEEKKRREKAELLKKDEELMNASKKKTEEPPVKFTQFAMNAQFEREQKAREKGRLEKEKESKRVAEQDFVLENVNHMRIDGSEARTVDEAIRVLGEGSGAADGEDKHPERRMKAAHRAFEERTMPALKLDNPPSSTRNSSNSVGRNGSSPRRIHSINPPPRHRHRHRRHQGIESAAAVKMHVC